MADGPLLAFQKGLIACLRADAGVSALVGARVYDEAPDDAVFPYVQLGDLNRGPVRGDGVETASLLNFGIVAHSRPVSGRVEASRISEAIIEAVDENPTAITVAGFRIVFVLAQMTITARAADGRSYESITAFEAMIEPTA